MKVKMDIVYYIIIMEGIIIYLEEKVGLSSILLLPLIKNVPMMSILDKSIIVELLLERCQ